MAPHAGFSRHLQRTSSPPSPEDTSMDSAPDGASGSAEGRYQMLNPSPLVPTSEWLPMELTLPEYLRSVTGVQDLRQLKHLKLRVIASEASIQRISVYAPSLVHLDLQGSCLGSLRDLGCGLLALEVLSVSRCGLTSLDGTYGFPSLKDFTASYNEIKDVAPCSAIENLRYLDVRGNQISDIECIGFLRICPKLEELVLLDCPVTRTRHYRRAVLNILPSLITLDMEPLADDVFSTKGSLSEEDEISDEISDFEEEWRELSESCENKVNETKTAKIGPSEGGNGLEVTEVEEKETGKAAELCPSEASPEKEESALDEERAEKVQKELLPMSMRLPTRKMRPASAHARLQNEQPTISRAITFEAQRRRPQTSVGRNMRLGNEERYPISRNPFLNSDESPSSLTSGISVCGNIAAALLSSNARVRTASMNAIARSSTPVKSQPEKPPQAEIKEKSVNLRGDILEASRKWREAYALFRQQNREKWEKEAEEDEDKDSPKIKSEDEDKDKTEVVGKGMMSEE